MVSLSDVILAFIFFPSHLDRYLFTLCSFLVGRQTCLLVYCWFVRSDNSIFPLNVADMQTFWFRQLVPALGVMLQGKVTCAFNYCSDVEAHASLAPSESQSPRTLTPLFCFRGPLVMPEGERTMWNNFHQILCIYVTIVTVLCISIIQI